MNDFTKGFILFMIVRVIMLLLFAATLLLILIFT